ncbi:MAG: molybdenum cofactor guanylyltransferase [Pedosphaera sp.]|nr:molybdenum cofactor guanylyltransferase [Pedosphaera sp.]
MGSDKARLRLGRWTLLGHVRRAAEATGKRVSVIRKDVVPRSGPLGGIYTGLVKCRAEAVLFLSCDMPLLTSALLLKVIALGWQDRPAVFTKVRGKSGFPFIIRRDSFPLIRSAVDEADLSLQSLARRLRARYFVPDAAELGQLANINTPDELEAVRRRIVEASGRKRK